MRGLGIAAAILVGLAGGGTRASADDAAAPGLAYHKGQFGASARLSLIGARAIVTYDNSVYCGKTDPQGEFGYASVCTGRTPVALDLEGSYGVKPTFELTLELRVGLESDFGSAPNMDGPHPFHLAPGARFFFSDNAKLKLFVQPELVIDLAGYSQGNDLGVKGIQGLWIDLQRHYGFYAFVGETAEFARWLSASFEVGVGFQGRYP